MNRPTIAQIQDKIEKQKKKQTLADVRISTASELQKKTFPELRWIVPGRVTEGLVLLAGKPKAGKSWLALDIAVAVASGGKFLGRDCQQGDVLGLFLEDTDRRLQRRLTSMLGYSKELWPERLAYTTEWPRLSEGGSDLILQWIKSKKEPRLVIVDILAKVRDHGKRQGDAQYAADYEALTELQRIAGETGVTILVLHHQRKATAEDIMDTVSGTLGLNGAADTILVLAKDAASQFWCGRGRDIEEFSEAIQFEKFRWQPLGQHVADITTAERGRIMQVLVKAGGSIALAEIAKALPQMKYENVKNRLSDMAKDGVVERVAKGIYRVPKAEELPF